MLNDKEQKFWNSYLLSHKSDFNPRSSVRASMSGDKNIADELLGLYLSGKKTAGSSLLKDYEASDDELPQIGDFWIILDSKSEPRCIVKTINIEIYPFDKVSKEVAMAEGEGDLSIEYWKQAHNYFFTPFLEGLKIKDLNKEKVVTEFFQLVFDS